MLIHKVKSGECPFSISRKYGIPPTKLISDNGISGDRLIEGEELVIIIPTRTVTVRGSDTLEALSARFGVRRSAIVANNPSLAGKSSLTPGQVLAIKQAAPIAAASAVGYLRSGITREKLTRSLPYLTYYLVCAATYRDGELKPQYDPRRELDVLIREGKLALLYVNDESNAGYLQSSEESQRLISDMIAAAKSQGYSGICFGTTAASDERFCSFVIEARKSFIGSDLLFFTEVRADGAEAAELSDGAVLCTDSLSACDEVALLSDFAENAESSKIFVKLRTGAMLGDAAICLSEARRLCIRSGGTVFRISDTERGFTYTRYRRGKGEELSVRFPSYEYTKA